MSLIKSKDTKPELLVRQYLHSRGLRYRLHRKDLPGKPDIVFGKLKTAIFVHGCFWHGHENCKEFRLPKTRTEWWKEKIDKNIQRDMKNIKKLEALGWKTIVIWSCEISPGSLEGLYETIKRKT